MRDERIWVSRRSWRGGFEDPHEDQYTKVHKESQKRGEEDIERNLILPSYAFRSKRAVMIEPFNANTTYFAMNHSLRLGKLTLLAIPYIPSFLTLSSARCFLNSRIHRGFQAR